MRNLSKTIRKNLLEVKETKSNLTQESNIIKNRFNVIVESPNVKTKNEMIRLYSRVIKESVNLRTLNHDNELINMYKNASDKKFAVDDEAAGLELAKQYITRCKTQHKFHFGTNKNLEYILNSRKKRVGIYGFRD